MDSSSKDDSMLTCDMCGVTTRLEYTLNEHLRGRLHQDNLDKLSEAEKTVYVKGFKSHVTQSDLKEYMSSFGQVASVWIDPAKHLYALVQFKSSADALKALQSSGLVKMDNKKLIIKPRKVTYTPVRARKRGRHDNSPSTNEVNQPVAGRKHRNLDSNVIAILSQPKPIDEQIVLLSEYNKMPLDSIKSQLLLCHLLQTQLQSHFPHCILIPFGATVSGHGTITSDCDICLMTNPDDQMRELFSPSNYFSPEVFALWKEITDKPTDTGTTASIADNLPMTTPTTVSMETQDDVDDSPNTSMTSSSSGSSPAPKQITPKRSPEFDIALSVISKMPNLTSVLSLAHARCPIIRFRCDLHCDLSVNNKLGPCNTRLMQAYYNFDSRFPLLIPIVRLWMKFIGPPRGQINNYSVSLMLIYALQRCSPPVLPCLQDPGAWPKNMAWFGEKGFSSSVKGKEDSIIVGKWRCDFTPPGSLMPSSNTESPLSLLIHFFNFYSQFQQVVTIHCPPDKTLTIDDAVRLADEVSSTNTSSQAGDENQTGKRDKHTKFVVSAPLCVQDPFELNHNIVKSLTKGNFASLTSNMKTAATILEKQKDSKEGSLLALFDSEQYSTVKVKVAPESLRKVVMFSKDDIVALLDQSDEFRILVDRLNELDLSNKATLQCLCRVVLRMVTRNLEKEMKFVVSPEVAEDETMDDETESVSLDTNQVQSSVVPGAAVTECVAAVPRKRHRSETDDGEIETISDDADGVVGAVCKDEANKEDVKRCKTDVKVAALDLLSHLSSTNGGADRYICTAFENTWSHTRRARRQQQQQQQSVPTATSGLTGSASNQPLLDALPVMATPLIHVALSLTPVVSLGQSIEGKICAIEVQTLGTFVRHQFETWFSLFKKKLMVLKK